MGLLVAHAYKSRILIYIGATNSNQLGEFIKFHSLQIQNQNELLKFHSYSLKFNINTINFA